MHTFESVKGKVAVVTGASSGIGRAIAITLAANGMKVVVGNRTEDKGRKVVDEIKAAGGEAVFCRCDIRSEEDVKSLIATAVDTYGKVHCMVNNAGVDHALHPVHDQETSEFDRVIETNLRGPFFGIKYAVKAMLETDSRQCSIVNIASGSGLTGLEGNCLYDTSKHGVIGLTKSAALDYAKHDITVNAICPGFVATGFVNSMPEEMKAQYATVIPAGRFCEPEEIANMVLFLASDMARFISGASYVIDGAQLAGNQNPGSTWLTKDPRKLK